MIHRDIEPELRNLARQYPVVTITGPRQAGKTTLARHVFPHHTYANLEQPDIRQLALSDPNAFFARFPTPAIIDEIQRAPELLSWIQVKVDEHNESGQYILTGSHQLQMGETISQSLAGRTALLKLLPLSIAELERAGIHLTRDEYLTRGFLPRIYDKGLEPVKTYAFYMETYVERDVRQYIHVRNLSQFEAFLKLLAGRVGQVLNLHSLARDVGVTSTTLANWLSVLEAAFVVHRIHPYHENFGKRVIKAPKVYFTEVGLASYLLGIQSPDQVGRDPLLGGLFENLVVNEILKARYNLGKPSGLHFMRDNHGNEVDLLLESDRQLVPIEVKAAMTWSERMAKGIRFVQSTAPNATKGYVVYAGDLEFQSDRHDVVGFRRSGEIAHRRPIAFLRNSI